MHPLPVSNIAASLAVADNDDSTNRWNLTNNEIQDNIELEVIEHNSNVEPINMPTTRTINNENQENFELESRGRSLSMNENQENIELQTISRIIDEQPENVPEISIELAHDLPAAIVENQIPNIQTTNPVRFNNNKFNKNLINNTGLVLLLITFIILYWYQKN